MNATALLKSDHRKLEGLLERYRSSSDGKHEIVREITRELSMHMDAEERALYPVLRTSIPDGKSLMNDALKEHQEARGLLADLEKADAGSFDMDAKVATLRRAIEHHVKDEEQEIFPKMEKSLGRKRVDELGTQIEKAKRSAPKRPPSSAARNSPGSSMRGIVSAATDRVKKLLTSDRRKPAKSASRAKKSSSRGRKGPRSAAKRARS